VTNIELAPDGAVWASGYATMWGGGGLMRYSPATKTWTYLGSSRPENLAIQPRPGGGYYVWAAQSPGYTGSAQRYDSTTGTWTTFPVTNGNPNILPGSRCVDAAGNLWIHRVLSDNFSTVLDCRRPDGTWIGRPAPPGEVGVLNAFAVGQAVAAGGSQIYKFNGTSWQGMGNWGNVSWTYDLGVDSAGAIWASGVGGAAKRNPQTGAWQRHRLTNNGNIDAWNNDISLVPGGGLYACSNGGPGVGGIVHFDGVRWINFNAATYGLGFGWPFPTDNAESIYAGANGRVAVNPMYDGTHEWNGSSWTDLGGTSTVVGYTEDSLGRLWALGEYYNLAYHDGAVWRQTGIVGWGARIDKDPDRPGTIWATTGYGIKRTDGTYSFTRDIGDFPQLTTQSDQFSGLAVDRNGVAWIGATVMLGAGGEGGGLIRIDSNTGTYKIWTYDQGWPFPAKYVTPIAATPDGRIWMAYNNTYQYFDGGLLWWDGQRVGLYPGPANGAPQWGGLPHNQIWDWEVRTFKGGYELWLVCASRGIAVLTVRTPVRQ
jgi:hypothetical protein